MLETLFHDTFIGGAVFLFLLAMVLIALVVQLWPHPFDKLHTSHDVLGPVNEEIPGGFLHRHFVDAKDAPAVLARIDEMIHEQPKTSRVRGSLEEGHVTYVTRGGLLGFPDYTTIAILKHPGIEDKRVISVRGHVTFCSSDLGTNKHRIKAWMERLHEETGTPV